MLKYSIGLRNGLMNVGSLSDLLTGCEIRIYEGPVPASPNDAVGVATKLCTITLDDTGAGLSFESTVTDGTLSKSFSEVWRGTCAETGVATFFRVVGDQGDSDGVSMTAYRIQGVVGVAGADMNLSNPGLTQGGVQTIDNFYLTMPES